MKKILFFILILFYSSRVNSQSVKCDEIKFNHSVNKQIEWSTSNYGDGFGHKIYNLDPGGKTLLNFAARHNSSDWINALTITSQGRVGIGTMDPIALFQVNGTTRLSGTVTIESKLNQYLGSNINDTQLLYRIAGRSGNYFMNNVWLRRDAQGSDWLSARLHNGISIDKSFLSPGIDTRTWWERDPYNNIQSWGNGNQTYMTLRSGKLGIGTETPDSELAVNGTIHTKEIKVDINGWSDFVFDNNYELKSIEEVEQYIKKNGHLSEIPDQETVEKDGVNLGEMNAKLLQKIEELTLYTITQQKEIEELKEQNSEITKLKGIIERNGEISLLKEEIQVFREDMKSLKEENKYLRDKIDQMIGVVGKKW